MTVTLSATTADIVTLTGFSWLPPWPKNVGVHHVVRHFLFHNPLGRGLNNAETTTYFLGFLQAFDAASTDDLTDAVACRWYEDMRRAITDCLSGDDGERTDP